MNLKTSVNADVGGSVKGAADAAANAKAAVSGGVKGAAGAAAGKVSGAVGGVADAAGALKDKATGAVDAAKASASAAIDGVKARAAEAVKLAAAMKENCKAAVERFKDCAVAPADGWKTSFASSGSISIGKSFSASSGITLRNDRYKVSNEVVLSFDINPNDVLHEDDTFTLFSTDGAETYREVKTVKDDLDIQDDILTIKYEGLDEDLEYSLLIDSGKEGNPYYLFENRPYGDWIAEKSLKITFNIDPNDPEHENDVFTLMSTDANVTIKQTKTIKDDLEKDNESVTLVFNDLDATLSYRLEIEPGDGGNPFTLFDNRPYGNWKD